MKPCRLGVFKTVQGIGDIIWCYQKLIPYFDELEFEILYIPTDNQTHAKVQKRSEHVIKSLPHVRDVRYVTSNSDEYTQLATGILHVNDFLGFIQNKDVYHGQYACNKPLENGSHLEDIDPLLKVEWNIDFPRAHFSNQEGKYLLVYVSGDSYRAKPDLKYLWDIMTWKDVILKINSRLGNLPIHLIGANFDDQVLTDLQSELKRHILIVNKSIDLKPTTLFETIRNAEFFIGYQSGLNILADNMNVKQLMVYFDYLTEMKDSWVKPENRTNGKFNYCFFSSNRQDVISKLRF